MIAVQIQWRNATKFVIARRPEADVAISGRHSQFVQIDDKNVQTDRVCSGAQRAPCRLTSYRGTSPTVSTTRFVIPRSEATWESPAAGYVFAEAHLLSDMVLQECHVGRWPPRNDTSGRYGGAPEPFCG